MPGIPVYVNIVWDPTAGYNTHTYWDPALTSAPPPGVPKPGTPTYAIEMIATQMWTAGYALGSNKFTETVKHLGMPICVSGHDIGILIPDVTIPFTNLYYAIAWPFSERKMTFAASTVLMNKNPTACSQIFPPLPMMTCGDPLTLPNAYPLANLTHSLTVGMTLGDLLWGLASIAVSVAIDCVFEWGGKAYQGIARRFGKEAAEAAGERVAREAAEEAAESASRVLTRQLLNEVAGKLGLTPKSLAKRGVNGLAGFGLEAAQGNANPTFKVGVGGGPVPQLGVQSGGDADGEDRFGTTEVGGVPVGGTFGNTPTNDPLDII